MNHGPGPLHLRMLPDFREGDLRSPEYDLDRARVGPATLRALSSTAGQDDGAVFPDAAVGDDDQENYLNPECPNAAVSNSTGLAAMQTSRRSLLRGRVRASGGAFGSGTEEKPTVRARHIGISWRWKLSCFDNRTAVS